MVFVTFHVKHSRYKTLQCSKGVLCVSIFSDTTVIPPPADLILVAALISIGMHIIFIFNLRHDIQDGSGEGRTESIRYEYSLAPPRFAKTFKKYIGLMSHFHLCMQQLKFETPGINESGKAILTKCKKWSSFSHRRGSPENPRYSGHHDHA